MSAVALNSILWQGSRMILPAIGGVLITLADTALVFGLSALGFLAMMLVMRSLEVVQDIRPGSEPRREFVECARFILLKARP